MHVSHRPYNGADDLAKLQLFTAQNAAQVGACSQRHVGDIPHSIYNALRRFEPSAVVHLWEDDLGNLLGWVMLWPNSFPSFEFYVRPDLWPSDLPQELLTWAEARLIALLRDQGEVPTLNPEAMNCDPARISLYEANGYTYLEPVLVQTMCSLRQPIAEFSLPDGFSIRSAAGDHEADKLAVVHHGAFNSNWTADEYRVLMNTPGYSAEREFVVVAPDGNFAAFTVTWIDTLNKSILFEPVGTHSEYQRKGLGRALMSYVMRQAKADGIETAYVGHEADNPASSGLYYSLGFQPVYEINVFQKKFT
jgi:mycothiol synthase